ncbi:thiolase family protein [Desulfogranum mediterraneum]|uniref:thiolase family protein n=1 Tax=Desulfogranum mediterraneum TaxID=160661 RepID=UPI0004034519|nr:thiolase family protein [Desulfogranum mediterraneum]
MAITDQDIFIVEALRTPFGSFLGSLAEVPAPELAAAVIPELLGRSGLGGTLVDEVIIGQVLQGGCGQAPARQAMRLAGLPDQVHALTINKVCGSGLVAMMLAANTIRAGEASLVIAGGMENMSLAPHVLARARKGQRFGHGEILDLLLLDGLEDAASGRSMGEITEEWLRGHRISRREQDAYALRSYGLAQQALKEQIFAPELVEVRFNSGKGWLVVAEDEEPWRCDPEKFASLPTVFREQGSITAGNASTINDGAALALVAGGAAVERYGLRPRARLVAAATASTGPQLFPEADVEAIRLAVARAGLSLEDIDLFEINEAFAAVALLTMELLAIDPARVNVNGGAVAIGHPIGASGGRLVATLIRELERQEKRYGVVTLCIGGGEAVAAVFERI